MPITKEEAQAVIDLYDYAMESGDLYALLKLQGLFAKADKGDYNAEGLIWAIICELDRRKAKAKKEQGSKGNDRDNSEK